MPDDTCPLIDSVISELEELREANTQLRKCAQYWEEAHDEMEKETGGEIDELNSKIAELENEIASADGGSE